jgi:hypothetical protein
MPTHAYRYSLLRHEYSFIPVFFFWFTFFWFFEFTVILFPFLFNPFSCAIDFQTILLFQVEEEREGGVSLPIMSDYSSIIDYG